MSQVTTAEQLAQRALDVNIIDEVQLQSVWSELGSRTVPLAGFQQLMLRRDLITQYQLERLLQGLRTGFFYGDYKVQYCVGAGTFARVFRAKHRTSGEQVAVKVLRNRFGNTKVNPKNQEVIDSFRREGELGRSFDHPNIVPIHEVYSKGVMHFIAMDFIEGRNLREFYRARRRFNPLEAAHVVSGIMAGLNYAFQKGFTHRDMKMSNVLVSSDGVAKLIDFGLAGQNVGDGDDGESVNQRTVDYAGLERTTGVRKDDTRSDIFFAGCVFYELLSGVPAMEENTERAQKSGKSRFQNIKPILEVAPDIPLPLAMVVNKSIEFDPERRYQTPADMLMDIKLAVKRTKSAAKGEKTSKQALASREGIDPQGEPRRLMVVESDTKMQNMLRELFKKNGYRVLVSSDPDRVLNRFYDDHRAADLILFTTGSNGRAALDIFNRFGEEALTSDLPAVLLLDEHHHDWESDALVSQHRAVAKMPIKQRQLREVILGVGKREVSP